MSDSVPTMTEGDRETLDEIAQTVREVHGEDVMVKHTDYDRGRLQIQLRGQAMDEASLWARLIHDMRDRGYKPEDVYAAVVSEDPGVKALEGLFQVDEQ